jgi:cytoskeletal protein RodZ
MTTLPSESSGNTHTAHTRPPENDSAGLGELLRRARENRGLTLEQISNETRIPRRHLEALEHDNLAAVPGGFYRRAEIRAYARAVNLDQDLALTALDRALAVPEPPRRPEPTLSRTRLLLMIGVSVAAVVFGRAMAEREPALNGDTAVRSATDSVQHSGGPSVREASPNGVVAASQRAQPEQVAPPSAPSDGTPAVMMEPGGARTQAASNGDLAVTTEQADARASGDSVTELVVTTQPAGARVTVNGIGWGTAPVTIRHLPPGDKRIRVSKDGYATEERSVRLVEGRLRRLDLQLNSAP